MKYKFLLFTLALFTISFVSAQNYGIIGTAADGWTTDIMLTDNGDGTYSIDALQLSNGEAKFRSNQVWAQNPSDTPDYGGTGFPTGTIDGNLGSPNIQATAGTYDITLDLNNNTYNFVSVSSANDNALITGYVDSTCSGADGRTVEVYVNGTVNFTGWTLQRQANGGGFTTNIDLSALGTVSDSLFTLLTTQLHLMRNSRSLTTSSRTETSPVTEMMLFS